MTKEDKQLHCDDELGICGLSPEDSLTHPRYKKKLELYIFTDPLCPECWAFEPTLKKLVLEYGHYFSMRFFVAADLEAWNKGEARQNKEQKNLAELYEATASRTGMSCDGDVWLENPVASAYLPSLAMKAAEMQGRQLAGVFFRRLREMLFVHKKNIANEEVLVACAETVGLDIHEFKKDIHSHCTAKALQCDIKTSKEMEVESAPTFVFFNDCVEDGGLKISGVYPYEVYVDILKEMLGEVPQPSAKLPLENFLRKYEFVATKEVAVVYDLAERDAEAQLKKLVLQRKLKRIPVKYGTFWRYIGE
ncbi:Predicted dithiol-disulfide isomerase, DsbA family [Alteribacillus persepolensis]|uniref:ClpXP adapter protein SpxH n=1 Tax=Alteribacillus persepolensis TaxID=568899 RepID=A0A1G8EPU2_9BACI|nr:ClpXP adapter SpxH family protein [Alteribacillus persepolensis]SDH71916.1 Predicted dithiol-disulfide isomerase, DsbA family [Alteribacillus persepolensis]